MIIAAVAARRVFKLLSWLFSRSLLDIDNRRSTMSTSEVQFSLEETRRAARRGVERADLTLRASGNSLYPGRKLDVSRSVGRRVIGSSRGKLEIAECDYVASLLSPSMADNWVRNRAETSPTTWPCANASRLTYTAGSIRSTTVLVIGPLALFIVIDLETFSGRKASPDYVSQRLYCVECGRTSFWCHVKFWSLTG